MRILLRDIYHLVTGDGARLRGVDVLVDGPRIADMGSNLPRGDAEVIDCSTKLVIPGLVNTHHHMFQVLARALPVSQNAGLFDWLQAMYPIWQHLGAEDLHVATQVACAELLKTGCTTTADHHYLFPGDLDREMTSAQIEAARQVGIRFCVMRGSMSVGKGLGGLPPDSIVQPVEVILRSSEALARAHDGSDLSLLKVALAPCAPFNVCPELMQETATLARREGLRLHTHLAETKDEASYCLEHFGCRPLKLLERWKWLGPDVWLAHGIHFDDAELDLLARTGTGISHCASSNMRLGSGICRVPELLKRGVTVGLGVDGSASNDSSDMLGELRNCLLLQRVGSSAASLTAEDVLRMGTSAGAELLGWGSSVGRLRVGWAADLVAIDLSRLDYAGATSDPLAAVLFCGISHVVDTTIVHGRVAVRDGRLTGLDEDELRDRANQISRRLLERAGQETKWML